MGALLHLLWVWLWGAGSGGFADVRCTMGRHWRLGAVDAGTSSFEVICVG